MNRIIVPIDFSEYSMKGIELAILLSKKIPSQIQLLYVMRKSADYSPGTQQEEERYAEKKFQGLIAHYTNKLHPNSELKYIIRSGKIYKEVVSQAESFDQSFIVATTHGASGFENLFIGSNAFKIVTATTRPVFTTRGDDLPEYIRRIVMPIDISADTRQKVPFTVRIAKECGAEIHVVNVSTTQAEDIHRRLELYQKQVLEYIEKYDVRCKSGTIVGANLTDITIDYAKQVDADMISIMTEQPKDLGNLVLGNYAQQMLNKSPIPVLCITPKELHIAGAFHTQG